MSDYKTTEQVAFGDLYAELKEHFPKLTGRQVAAALQIAPSFVSQILNGERNPGRLTLEEMRKYVNRELGRNDPDQSAALLPVWQHELIELLAQLQIEDRNTIIKTIKLMANGILKHPLADADEKPSSKPISPAARAAMKIADEVRRHVPK